MFQPRTHNWKGKILWQQQHNDAVAPATMKTVLKKNTGEVQEVTKSTETGSRNAAAAAVADLLPGNRKNNTKSHHAADVTVADAPMTMKKITNNPVHAGNMRKKKIIKPLNADGVGPAAADSPQWTRNASGKSLLKADARLIAALADLPRWMKTSNAKSHPKADARR